MVSPIFSQEQTCPICSTKFLIQRVRSSALRILRRDTDFCVIYEGANPLVYSVWVCPECHFAATDQHFHDELSNFQIERLKKGLALLKGEEPDFSGERTWDVVIRSCELAIRTAQIYQAKSSYLGSLFLRAAWACRFAGKQTLEKDYITQAAVHYQKGFEGESRDTKVSEPKMLYLIGELNRRAGHPKESIIWFSRAVSHPGIKREAEVDRLTRDQWLQAKNDAKELEDSELKDPLDLGESGEQLDSQEAVADSGADADLEADAKLEDEDHNGFPSFSKNRRTASMLVQIYQDNVSWLQGVTNKSHEQHRQLLEKTAIIRALLDAASLIEIPSDDIKDEDTLRQFFIQRFNI